MNIDTEKCRKIAGQLEAWQKWIYFNEFELDHRHQQIQAGLQSLQTYFANMAAQAEQVENSIRPHSQSYWKVNHHFTPVSNFLGKKSAFSMGASVLYHAHHSYRENEHASLTTNVGNFQASGTCQAGIWKDKILDPRIQIQAHSQASLLDATATTKMGVKKVYFETKETAKVGVVVAKAEAILCKEEQTIGFHIGASALEGEAQCAFHIANLTITLTASQSIGTIEANMSYSHKNKEWEFGSKLGFIAGLGFKVNVKY